ncbi:MAG: FAD-binding protein [bacterium]|nr:FAD-binding protein [bacterium]
MNEIYDIAIIGLGPAGSTVARCLNKDYKIIAFDKKDEKDMKCCGGLLSPDAQKLLAKFDLCLPTEVLIDPQIFSVRTIDFSNKLERYYQRFYLNMDRGKFDRWLISLIKSNVKIEKALCTKVVKQDDLYEVYYKQNNKTLKIKAKIIIDSAGAFSLVRRTFYNNKKIKRYTSIQEWYKCNSNSSIYTSIFDNKLTNSYCWTISKNGYFIVGGAFKSNNAVESFSNLKTKLKDYGYDFGDFTKREGCYVYLLDRLSGIETGSNGIYLLGESAGFISPSSLEGISYAMESGYILADVLNKNINAKSSIYKRKTLKLRIKLFIKMLKRPFMYNRCLRYLIMKSGIDSIKKLK